MYGACENPGEIGLEAINENVSQRKLSALPGPLARAERLPWWGRRFRLPTKFSRFLSDEWVWVRTEFRNRGTSMERREGVCHASRTQRVNLRWPRTGVGAYPFIEAIGSVPVVGALGEGLDPLPLADRRRGRDRRVSRRMWSRGVEPNAGTAAAMAARKRNRWPSATPQSPASRRFRSPGPPAGNFRELQIDRRNQMTIFNILFALFMASANTAGSGGTYVILTEAMAGT